MAEKQNPTFAITKSRLLYVLEIKDEKHRGLIKVGEVFVDKEKADDPNETDRQKTVCEELKKRPYMKDVSFEIKHAECTTYKQGTKCYKAEDVHRTLETKLNKTKRYLGKYKVNNRTEDADIWWKSTLEDVKAAIELIRDGKGAGKGDIVFRPEQEEAIKKTVKCLKKKDGKTSRVKHYLWNAKMRFGKTLSGLEVARRCQFRSILIITHRPVVDKGWEEDFDKIFKKAGALKDYENPVNLEAAYGRRMVDDNDSDGDFYSLTKDVDAGKKVLVFFVSMQYLRLSQSVGGKEKKLDPLKRDIMKYDWDFVMVDEAHEGIEADAGRRVMEKLKKRNTRFLSLSGTPFNLLDKYDQDEIYTWDYVMEQRAKLRWEDEHFGDPNPYAELPRMNILTFHLDQMTGKEIQKDNEMFRLHEFFRVWTENDRNLLNKQISEEKDTKRRNDLQAELRKMELGKFVYEDDVKRFVEKLRTKSDKSLYPFSTEEFRKNFSHTFWILPGVKEAAAMEKILKEDPTFGTGVFEIINAAGEGNIEDKNGSALADVKKKIKSGKRTITLSCGKLTTGVSVPEWTAVLCMKGSENTPAANYMQTIFRVQTHAVLDGRQKTDCYVFDFAPDRALTAVAETSKMGVYAQTEKGKQRMKLSQKKEEEHLADFIKLCPVLSMDEGSMGTPFDAKQIFEKLSNVYIERAVRSGYADNSIYNHDKLLNLTPEQEKALGDVRDLLGSMPNIWKPAKITINKQGIGDVKDAEDVKYVYYLSDNSTVPQPPLISSDKDDDGRPMTDDEGWTDEMCGPTQAFPYLFTSMARKENGSWSEFSKPILWRKWSEPETDDEKDEAKKKRKKDNKEKRARMSVLRGVAIRIPLLVYGAEINDDAGEEITIDNFADDKIVDDASWEEFMPKGFTKDTFKLLKDCFDRNIFTGAAKRIRQMVKEADHLDIEDRIARIATIFSYFHNPDKETVLTPWRVVNMQLSDTLGGWCFMNEQFDDEYIDENEKGEVIRNRFVDKGDVTKDIFGDPNSRILEINSKTGLYPLYMAYSIFRGSKEPEFQLAGLTKERRQSTDKEENCNQTKNDLVIWESALKDNIFVVCRTPMAVSITKRTLAGFNNELSKNLHVKCYKHNVSVKDLIKAGVLKKDDKNIIREGEKYFYKVDDKNVVEELPRDMIDVLRAKPELFQKDVVQGIDFWGVYESISKNKNENINDMKFKAVVGNPPYQINDGSGASDDAANPIYQEFVRSSLALLPSYISLIMPSKWMIGGKAILRKFKEEMMNDSYLSDIFDFENDREIFPNAHNDGGICYILWNSNNKQKGLVHFRYKDLSGYIDESSRLLKIPNVDIVIRDSRRIPIITKVLEDKNSLSKIISKTQPFGVRKDLFNKPERYPNANPSQSYFNDSVKIYGVKGIKGAAKRQEAYVNKAIISKNVELVNKWKLFFTTSYSTNAVIAPEDIQSVPGSACTETFIVIGPFDSEQEMLNCHTYLHTTLVRALLYFGHGTMQVTASVFQFVPLQDFTSKSDIDWTKSIPKIDEQLYKKYDLSPEEVDFIDKMVNHMD